MLKKHSVVFIKFKFLILYYLIFILFYYLTFISFYFNSFVFLFHTYKTIHYFKENSSD